MDTKCHCNLCYAQEIGCHPWELMFGIQTKSAKLIRRFPGLEVYQYDPPKNGQVGGSAFRFANNRIAESAYYLWINAGRPQHRDLEFWLASETDFWNT